MKWAESRATALHGAMAGWGTAEDQLIRVIICANFKENGGSANSVQLTTQKERYNREREREEIGREMDMEMQSGGFSLILFANPIRSDKSSRKPTSGCLALSDQAKKIQKQVQARMLV